MCRHSRCNRHNGNLNASKKRDHGEAVDVRSYWKNEVRPWPARRLDRDLDRGGIWNAWMLELCRSQGHDRRRLALDHRSMGKPSETQGFAVPSVCASGNRQGKANTRGLWRAL